MQRSVVDVAVTCAVPPSATLTPTLSHQGRGGCRCGRAIAVVRPCPRADAGLQKHQQRSPLWERARVRGWTTRPSRSRIWWRGSASSTGSSAPSGSALGGCWRTGSCWDFASSGSGTWQTSGYSMSARSSECRTPFWISTGRSCPTRSTSTSGSKRTNRRGYIRLTSSSTRRSKRRCRAGRAVPTRSSCIWASNGRWLATVLRC